MCHKLSNTANRYLLEKEFNRLVKYPHLYKKQVLINGLEEATIPIIAMEEKHFIVPAIWGILPEDYTEDWHVFQNAFASLSLNIGSLNNPSWFANALLYRRCLIPITGFFTSYLINGVLYPYYFHLKSGLPFCFAGIYNKTEDGFLTCSIITTHSDDRLNDVQNMDPSIPILLPKKLHSKWLSEDLKEDEIRELLHIVPNFRLIAHPISKEFFNNNISFNSMLAPVFYDAVPKQIVLEQGLHFLSL